MRLASVLIVSGMFASSPAWAEEAMVDVGAGRAGAVAIALARQSGASIVIADSAVANRMVPAIRGRMRVEEAVRALARAAGASVVTVGPSAWRLVPIPPPARRPPPRPAAAAARPDPKPEPVPESEPIVVEGSKRDLQFEQYPGQVSILDGEDLVVGGIGGSEKITQRIATVSSTHLGSGRNKLFIRGIADSSFTGPTQATVGQYLGDLRLSYNAPDPDLRLSDIERIEVLEGPQGALYGAGSLGGIIRIVPRMPQLGVTSGSAIVGGSLTQDGAAGGDASATLNLPLGGDVAALRMTVDAASQGGYIDKPFIGRDNVNRTRILGGRGIARFEAAPNVTIDLIGLGQTIDADDSQYADRNGDPLTSSARVREGSRADYAQGQLVISAHFGSINLRSSTGATGQNLAERYDATVPGGPARLFEQANDTHLIAHETRIWRTPGSSFGWLIGASYTHNSTRLTRSFIESDVRTLTTGVRNRIDEATLYGEASLPLVPGLTATAGGRLTHSRLGGSGEDVPALVALARADITANRSETRFLPSASLLAELQDRTSIYLRYQEGYRPGGLAIENDFVRRFRNDHTYTFEVGARHGRPGVGPFDVSLSMSYTRWMNIQADFIDSVGLPSSANIGDGRVWSASLSGGVLLAPGLRIDAGLTLNQSRVDKPILTALLPYLASSSISEQLAALYARTNQVPNIADFAGRLGFEFSRALGSDRILDARGWVSYVGRSRLGIGPELGEPQGDYLDSGLNLRVGRERFGVSLGITNIANVRGNRFSLGTPFSIGREQVTPLRPRTVRLGLDASF